MGFQARLKELTIAAGVYLPARRLYRWLNPGRLQAHNEEVRFYKSWLPTSALCFDIGANIGEKSESLLRAGARVVSFEPNPLLISELSARLMGEENWTMVLAAIGSAPAILKFYVREIHGHSSLDEGGAQEWQGPLRGTYTVPVVTLDSAIETFGVPYFCKIDVEGWELEVLNGLSNPVPIICFEFHLNPKDIEKTRRCLVRMREFGEGFVNVIPAESCDFLFESWMTLEQFVGWFPGDLHQTLSADLYGDIYVRNADARIPSKLPEMLSEVRVFDQR